MFRKRYIVARGDYIFRRCWTRRGAQRVANWFNNDILTRLFKLEYTRVEKINPKR